MLFPRRLGVFVLSCLVCLPLLQAGPAAMRAESRDGVIVSGSKESTRIGLKILERGGNAADAAVAVSLSLGISEAFGSGLGGKLIVLYYDARTGSIHCIEAMDQAPASLSVPDYTARSTEQRETGYGSACIPGLAAGLELLHKKWGSLPWKDCVYPAEHLAREGFIVPPEQLVVFRDGLRKVKDKEALRLYFPGGKPPDAGTKLPNTDLANTLKILGDQGAKGFYEGDIAKKIAAASKAGGGWITEADLRGYRAHELSPLMADYKKYKIFTSPPPTSGGATLLLAMKALENHDWAGAGPLDLSRIDATARVFQQVYPISSGNFADVPDAQARINRVLRSTTYSAIAEHAERCDPSKPYDGDAKSIVGEGESGSTTHFIVADREGNIVCATQSLSHHFGATVVVPGTGILLNNTMTDFAYGSRTGVNYAAGGKRPRSTMTPVIVTEQGKPVIAIGSPAAQRIPTGVYQVLSAMIDFNQSAEDAVNETRFHTRNRGGSGDPPNVIDLEDGFGSDVGPALEAKNWVIYPKRSDNYYFGGVNVVRFLPNGIREVVADTRRSNWAEGQPSH